jgi:FkbM family methyltransferase
MRDLLARKRVASFGPLLAAYAKSGAAIRNAIDGGAGSGSTAIAMLRHIPVPGTVHAFEPFPGNHKFFEKCDKRVVLHKQALAAEKKTMTLAVSNVVQPDSVWGKKGMAGYSSAGYLTDKPRADAKVFSVDCAAADDVIAASLPIDFVKLDLQGGELNALRGMTRILSEVKLMWIEFSYQSGLLDFLQKDFAVFDTEYLFRGAPDSFALEHFEISREGITRSNGTAAWFGFKKHPWQDYHGEFRMFREKLGLVQTDIACVPKTRMAEFSKAVERIKPSAASAKNAAN